MGAQQTASKTYELLNCPRPFDASTHIEPQEAGEPSRWGSAVHEVCEGILKDAPRPAIEIAEKWGFVAEQAPDLFKHAADIVRCFSRWAAGDNDWNAIFSVKSVEGHVATRLLRRTGGHIEVKSRECDFDADPHIYDLASHEFGGTYDILAWADTGHQNVQCRAVIDIKTGEEDWHGGSYAEPKTVHQLLTLALQNDANIVGILHAPRGEEPVMYAAEVSAAELQAHASSLRKAQKMIGSGYIRPGDWCRFCPARVGCPARDAELLTRASALVRSVTAQPLALPVELGEFHMMYQEMGRVMKRAGEEMKALVKEGEKTGVYHVRPDGAPLEIRRYPRDNISLASIRRAVPGRAGEKLIRDLRKRGCVETTQVEALVAGKAE